MSAERHLSANRSKNGFDLEAIRDIIDQDSVDKLNGVKNTDVDWILRDSNIDRPLSNKDSGRLKSSNNGMVDKSNCRSPTNSPVSPVSPHLLANISNTNENNTNKTRPSMAPIQEEIASTSKPTSEQSNESGRRRESVSSIGSQGGFFSKLKGKFGHKSHDDQVGRSLIFKDNYSIGLRRPSTSSAEISNSPVGSKSRSSADYQTENLSLSRSMSTPNYSSSTSDPRLEEYIKFYQQKSLRSNSTAPSTRSSVSTSQSDGNNSLPVPSHPKNSPLPSALINRNEIQTECLPYEGSQSTGNKLSSFLRRRSSTNPPLPSVSMATERNRRNSESMGSTTSIPISTPSPPRNPDVLPEFIGLKPLKRVSFHSLTFLIDPPQQIPSRNPRRGNVEILPNGALKINPLSEEDKIAIEKSQIGQGGGIVVGGSGSLDTRKDENDEREKNNEDEAKKVKEASGMNLGKDDDETKVDKHAKLLGIDKPMLSHHKHNDFHSYDTTVKKMALDLMYTRCCHLREILPIPAILKQIPKGSLAPLPILQLRNPTPTMVEIQTFADFIRIAPILCISLDGVNMSLEQFKILLSAMSSKTQLEKLSLRNTPINPEGWSLLCWFLSRNKVLNRLDITQCPSLSVNISKKKKKSSSDKKDEITRMTCNKDNRSDMDWALFTATIVARGGIEELILTGCCITDLDIFETFIERAVLIKTNRLGLAYNNLTVKQFKVVVDTWLFKPFVRGLDVGYNDFLSLQYLNIFLQKRNDKEFDEHIRNCSLAFLSLNATNLRFSDAFKEVFETVVMKFPCLKYLDLSNNLKLFGSFGTPLSEPTNLEVPDKVGNSGSYLTADISKGSSAQASIVAYFTSKFPLFPKLIRLHVENNELSTSSLISISEVLPFCKNLAYFSVIGNKVDMTAATALTQALKNSNTLITLDCDYDEIPDFIKEKIGLYSMRNMERLLHLSKTPQDPTTNNTDKSNLSSLTEQLNDILSKKAEEKLDLQAPEVQRFINKATSIRQELKEAMNELLKLQVKNELNLDGKETFLRFLYIDSSIEKGLQLIDTSLIDNESVELNSSAMIRNFSEDEKNNHRVGNNYCDPVNNDIALRKSQDIPVSMSPLSLSRTSSKSNLSQLNRQEGSFLKLLKLHDYHSEQDSTSSDFFHSFDGLSGDEIRQKILNVDLGDLDKIIDYLAHLKEKGITLGEVFNLNDKCKTNNIQSEAYLVEEIMNKLKMANKIKSEATTEPSKETSENQETDTNSGNDNARDIREGDEISQAYDQVLTNLAKLN